MSRLLGHPSEPEHLLMRQRTQRLRGLQEEDIAVSSGKKNIDILGQMGSK